MYHDRCQSHGGGWMGSQCGNRPGIANSDKPHHARVPQEWVGLVICSQQFHQGPKGFLSTRLPERDCGMVADARTFIPEHPNQRQPDRPQSQVTGHLRGLRTDLGIRVREWQVVGPELCVELVKSPQRMHAREFGCIRRAHELKQDLACAAPNQFELRPLADPHVHVAEQSLQFIKATFAHSLAQQSLHFTAHRRLRCLGSSRRHTEPRPLGSHMPSQSPANNAPSGLNANEQAIIPDRNTCSFAISNEAPWASPERP